MSYPVYYVPAGDVVPIFFSTYAGSTGASITTSGLAVTDIEIYKDGSVTQRASDNGYTLLDTDGIDFDGLTGIHGFSIDTGDNSDASFYTVGAWFHVVVSTVTVDSQTVSFIAAAFRIMPAESSAAVPKVDVSHFGGTAGTFSGGRPEVNVNSNADKTGYAIGNGGIAAAAFAAGAIDASAVAANAIGASELAADAATEIAAAVFARAFSAAYGDYTFDELTKMFASVLLGKASGLDTNTATYRNLDDSGDVVVATVDADGNRTAVTRTP